MSTSRLLAYPPVPEDRTGTFDLLVRHGHQDLVQSVAFNAYGDRCATGSVDGRVRVFNRPRDGVWRLCDVWSAHGGEVLDLQWLPPTVYPSLIASLGAEGRFKLWAEDPAAVAGRRFAGVGAGGPRGVAGAGGLAGGGRDSAAASGRDAPPKAAYETRSRHGAPFRSFAMKHDEETRHTYLALLAADGVLSVLENEQVENLSSYANLDEWDVFSDGAGDGTGRGPPARGEETSFRVRFDPNPDVCYTALRAGVPTDALGLVVAAMDTVKVYRTRDTLKSVLGLSTPGKEFYLAAEIGGHRGLVRDVAWAPGNIRGYDILATACQDGFVRIFRLDTPLGPAAAAGKSWSASELKRHAKRASSDDGRAGASSPSAVAEGHPQQSGIRAGLDRSSRSHQDRRASAGGAAQAAQPGQIRHVVKEIAKLDSHRTPVWRVGFDDDGQILGSVGDDGRLMCYRQTSDGSWAKSSELSMVKVKMAAP